MKAVDKTFDKHLRFGTTYESKQFWAAQPLLASKPVYVKHGCKLPLHVWLVSPHEQPNDTAVLPDIKKQSIPSQLSIHYNKA